MWRSLEWEFGPRMSFPAKSIQHLGQPTNTDFLSYPGLVGQLTDGELMTCVSPKSRSRALAYTEELAWGKR